MLNLFRPAAFLAILMLCAGYINAQIKLSSEFPRTGFIYSPGISWTENQKQDSVLNILIEGDTMTAIRNLLTYCLQEKRENDNANIILSMINLDRLEKMFNSKDFTFYLAEYRKVKSKNDKVRKKTYPTKSN